MGDRCYMSVTCRRQDKERFEELGFHLEFDEDPSAPVIEMIDEEANYGHVGNMPDNIPFIAWLGGGGNYGDGKIVCDGCEYMYLAANNDGFMVDWNYRFGLPTLKSILQIRRYLKMKRRVNRMFKALPEEKPKEHLFSPHTHCCVKCGIHAEDDAVENLPWIK